VISRDAIFNELQPWDWINARNNTDQLPDTFIVEFERTDSYPTMAEVTEPGEQNSAVSGDGLLPDDQGEGDVVGPSEATSNPPNTPHHASGLDQASGSYEDEGPPKVQNYV
jgi:hypothetical protein